MDFYSPLRYPGGKGKISPYFKQIIKDNIICDGIYVEPYAGGAAVGLALLFNEYVSKIIINDVDLSIYAFWHSVLNETEKFCKLIEVTEVNIKNWEKQKNVQKYKENYTLLEIGFSTFFLNRTNRSGILKAGVIGGVKQKGKWKIDARYNKEDLIERIKKIAFYKNRIELYNLDAVKLVRLLSKKLPKNTLFYLDPPYYVKGKDLYLNYYNDDDHRRIALEISKIKKQKWIVTYDNAPLIKSLYANHKHLNYFLKYSAVESREGEELMIFSNNLYISKPDNFLKISH